MEENTFDLNREVVSGVNDVFVIHTVYYAVARGDPYNGTVSLEDIPTTVTERRATYQLGSKTGIRFSRSRALYAPSAGQDVEPSLRIDYRGNMSVGGIRGLTGGNDIWRFDLNPSYSYGSAVRNIDGSIAYTVRGAADAGVFDLASRTITVKVDLAKLNALQTRGAVGSGTTFIGLRGAPSVARATATGLVGVGLLDSTRGGGNFTVKNCQ